MTINQGEYLINELEKGRNLSIALISHNAYWPQVDKYRRYYDNCKVQVFGGGTAYVRMAKNDKNRRLEDNDLIIYYGGDIYSESEIEYLMNVASKISSDKNKRVTIGYSYFMPKKDGKEGIDYEVEIMSVKDGEIVTEKIDKPRYFDAFYLTELTLREHDNYEIEKNKKLEKK